jgi:hypothetical protein
MDKDNYDVQSKQYKNKFLFECLAVEQGTDMLSLADSNH